MARDPFLVLALPYDAAPDDVRQAFRRLARTTHPDRGGSAEAFHEVRVAYSALTADLDAERQRWQVPKAPPRPTTPGGLDPRAYPTCPIEVSRSRSGTRLVEYDVAACPSTWAPPDAPPPGGDCVARYPATASAPAFGIWIVPLDAERFRCVFGPVG